MAASGSAVRAGGAYVELFTDDSRLIKGLRAAEQKMKALGASVRTIGAGLMGAGSAVIAPMLGAVAAFTEMGSAINDMSVRTGISAESLSELGYAAGLAGVDMGSLEGGLKKMQKSIVDAADGSKEAKATLGDLGLTAAELKGLSGDQQFKLIADRISKISDPAERAAMSMKVFGKSGAALLPIMADGAKGITAAMQAARDLGISMSGKDAAAADEFGDSLDTLWAVVKMGAFNVGAALVPVLSEFVSMATKAAAAVTKWVSENRAMILTAFKIAAGVVAAGAAFFGIGVAITVAGATLGGIATVLTTVGAVIGSVVGGAVALFAALISPIGLVAVAITAASGAFLYFSGAGGTAINDLLSMFGTLKTDALAAFGGISDALSAGNFALAAQVLWTGLKMEWLRGTQALNEIWVGAKLAFMNGWTDAVTFFSGLFINAWAGIETGWVQAIGFLSDAWTGFYTAIQATWAKTVGFIADKMLAVLETLADWTGIDIGFNVADARKELADETKRKVAGIDASRDAVIGGRDIERRKRLAGIEATRQGALGENAAMADSEKEARAAAYGADLSAGQREIDAAKAAFADSVSQAAEAKAAADLNAKKKPVVAETEIGDARKATEDAKNSISGTFNAGAIRGFAVGGGPAERSAKAAEATLSEIRELRKTERERLMEEKRSKNPKFA